MVKYVVLIILMIVNSVVESSRILAFIPFPAKSHQRFIQPLLRELASRGYNVTCVSTFPMDNPPPENYTSIKIDDYWKRNSNTTFENSSPWPLIHYIEQTMPFSIFGIILKRYSMQFSEWVLQQKQVTELIESDAKFDLLIMECVAFQESFVGLGHRFNAPIIDYLSTGNVFWNYWLLGNPYDTSYIGSILVNYSDRMTFIQRLSNTVMNGVHNFILYYWGLSRFQYIMDKHLVYEGWETRPPIQDMISNTSLTLVNTHHSIDYPYPFSPNFIQVGGLHITPNKPLPQDIQIFMDDAKNGVILFSLGSSVGTSGMIDKKLRLTMIQVFSELKQRILWKWEDQFPDPQPPSNVKIAKWLPQQEILSHKNIKLFINHGGTLTTYETIAKGVVSITIPIFGDQFRNAEIIKYYNCGLTLQFYNLTYESLKWSINEVLNNPMYDENVKKRAKMFHDKPETALETAVYWTEYVLRHKGAHHLKPAISTMPWYQNAMIDVYAAILLIILIPIYIMYKIIKCFISCICCRRKNVNIIKKKKKLE